jgi:Flp pilus assembly protein TadG
MNINVSPRLKSNSKNRTSRGSLLVELCAAIPLLFVMIGLTTNAVLLVQAASLNDKITRESARAAAQSSDATSAKNAARAVISSFQLNPSFFTVDADAPEVFSFPTEGAESSDGPRVTVGTRLSVRLPFPLMPFGADSAGTKVGLRQQYTFPVVKLRLPKVTAIGSSGTDGSASM